MGLTEQVIEIKLRPCLKTQQKSTNLPNKKNDELEMTPKVPSSLYIHEHEHACLPAYIYAAVYSSMHLHVHMYEWQNVTLAPDDETLGTNAFLSINSLVNSSSNN